MASSKFRSDLPEVLARAEQAGIDRFISIADTIEEGEECLNLAKKYDQIFCTIGVHPHEASTWKQEDDELRVREIAAHSQCVAIGEIGLDYHYMNSPKEDQIRAFRDQIAIANDLNLPVVVHNRESIEDMLPIIRELQPKKMVLHCCTEKWSDVEELIDRGYLLGFTGIATYPKSDEIRETIRRCPLENMMVETDAPYLAPEGKRGQRCEPLFVQEVAKTIAAIHGISFEEVDRITTENAVQFYGLASVG